MKRKKDGRPTYFTSNKVHPEFATIQMAKKGQYYTDEKQLNIKAEPFYNQSVDELCKWYESNIAKVDEIKKSGLSIEEAMMDFPINYNGNDSIMSIADIVEVTFINCISRIINSYIKYGKKETTYRAENLHLKTLMKYLNLIFYSNNNKYSDLIIVLHSYFTWFNCRTKDLEIDNKSFVSSLPEEIDELIKQFLTNGIFVIPLSQPIDYYKTVKSTCIPVVSAVISSGTGHDTFLKANVNFMHDMLHMYGHASYGAKKHDYSQLYKKYIPFYKKYEELQEELKGIPLLDGLNYILFGIMHEQTGSHYIKLFKFKIPGFIQNIVDNLGINNYLVPVVILTKLLINVYMKDDVSTNEFDKFIDNAHKTNLTVKDEQQKGIPAVIKENDKFELLGNPTHIEYVDIDIFKQVFKLLDKLFTDLELYKKVIEEYIPKDMQSAKYLK